MADHTHVPTVDTSKEEAALACSRLPVLAYFREGSGRTTVGFFVAALNLLALAYLAWFFSSSCTTQHGVLPSESPSGDVADPDSYAPPALAELEDQAGATMLERSLIYYSATDTFERGGTVDGVDTSTLLSSIGSPNRSRAAAAPVVTATWLPVAERYLSLSSTSSVRRSKRRLRWRRGWWSGSTWG